MTRECESVNHTGRRESEETWDCPYCRKIYCTTCEGIADDDDPFEDSCDDCHCMLQVLDEMMATGRSVSIPWQGGKL